MDSLILLTTTSDDRTELEKIAAQLVQRKLAACCQIGDQPITSWYRWEGKTESTSEWVCEIKTIKRRFAEVAQAIGELHHYEEPQIVAIEICAASEGYQKWVRDCVD